MGKRVSRPDWVKASFRRYNQTYWAVPWYGNPLDTCDGCALRNRCVSPRNTRIVGGGRIQHFYGSACEQTLIYINPRGLEDYLIRRVSERMEQ